MGDWVLDKIEVFPLESGEFYVLGTWYQQEPDRPKKLWTPLYTIGQTFPSVAKVRQAVGKELGMEVPEC